MLIVYFKVNYNINVQTFCKFLASLKLFVLLVHFMVIFVLHGASGSLNSRPLGTFFFLFVYFVDFKKKKKKKKKKGKRKVQEVPQSQTAALPRHQETDNSKQAQLEQTYEKHLD